MKRLILLILGVLFIYNNAYSQYSIGGTIRAAAADTTTLKTYKAGRDGTMCYLIELDTGDGIGGGWFVYGDSTSSNLGVVRYKSGTAGKHWTRREYLENKYINVKWLAAKGNGSNDDTAELQAAIDAGALLGNDVYLPSGTYIISDSLALSNNSSIRGNGWNSIVQMLKANGTAKRIFAADTDTNVVISDLKILGDTTSANISQHDHAIEINSSQNVSINNCNFARCVGDGIYITGSSRIKISNNFFVGDSLDVTKFCARNGVSVVDGDYITIIGNHFWGFIVGWVDLEPNANGEIRHVVISNNIGTNGHTTGYSINAANTNSVIEYITVTGNIGDTTASRMMDIRGEPSSGSLCQEVTVTGNTFRYGNFDKVYAGMVYVHGNVNKWVISSNTFSDTPADAIFVFGGTDTISTPRNGIIANNVFADIDDGGVQIYSSTDAGSVLWTQVHGNLFRNCDGIPVDVDYAENLLVSDNVINVDDTTTMTRPYTFDNVDSLTFIGNYSTGRSTGGTTFTNTTLSSIGHNHDLTEVFYSLPPRHDDLYSAQNTTGMNIYLNTANGSDSLKIKTDQKGLLWSIDSNGDINGVGDVTYTDGSSTTGLGNSGNDAQIGYLTLTDSLGTVFYIRVKSDSTLKISQKKP